MAPKQCAIGMADLGLGGARRNSQEDVEIGALAGHDRMWIAGCESWSRPTAGTTTARSASRRPAGNGRRSGAGVAQYASDARRLGRAGGASSHLVTSIHMGDHLPSACRPFSYRNGGERCRPHPSIWRPAFVLADSVGDVSDQTLLIELPKISLTLRIRAAVGDNLVAAQPDTFKDLTMIFIKK